MQLSRVRSPPIWVENNCSTQRRAVWAAHSLPPSHKRFLKEASYPILQTTSFVHIDISCIASLDIDFVVCEDWECSDVLYTREEILKKYLQ